MGIGSGAVAQPREQRMHHFMIDGIRGLRARFDDICLIQELLDEIPALLGVQPVMPGFVLPYYNGVVAEDCGISAFVFLHGGHFTLHTFSFREAFFADFLSPVPFSSDTLQSLLHAALPCRKTQARSVTPGSMEHAREKIDRLSAFGPHYLVEIDGYEGPAGLDEIFDLFDSLPGQVGMTPIMRPYVIRTHMPGFGTVISAMTMIAESHISLHVFQEHSRACFDLFSCTFFDEEKVLPRLRSLFPGETYHEYMTCRGRDYKLLRTERPAELSRSKLWLAATEPGATSSGQEACREAHQDLS